MSEFDQERKRDIADNAEASVCDLNIYLCKRYLKKNGIFSGDTIANQTMMGFLSAVYKGQLLLGEPAWELIFDGMAREMATHIALNEVADLDMPDHYEEACRQIRFKRITTTAELAEFLDEAEPDVHDILCGTAVTIHLDESLCKALTALLIKPEAPIKVTAITGTVDGMESGPSEYDDTILELSDCRILTESR